MNSISSIVALATVVIAVCVPREAHAATADQMALNEARVFRIARSELGTPKGARDMGESYAASSLCHMLHGTRDRATLIAAGRALREVYVERGEDDLAIAWSAGAADIIAIHDRLTPSLCNQLLGVE